MIFRGGRCSSPRSASDLPDELKSIAKLFADDTSLFSIVQDPNESAKYLNLDLSVISQWA